MNAENKMQLTNWISCLRMRVCVIQAINTSFFFFITTDVLTSGSYKIMT